MLKGTLVGLRAIERDDLSRLLEWRNRPEYRRFFREYRELSHTNQLDWFESIQKSKNTFMFAIVRLSDNRMLGACGLCYINWVDRNADFSIYLGEEDLYIDDAYAPDAARLMIDYGFGELNLHRLWAEIYDFDEPKKRLFDQLGFRLEGCHRQTHWTEGRWHDSLFFSRLQTDAENEGA